MPQKDKCFHLPSRISHSPHLLKIKLSCGKVKGYGVGVAVGVALGVAVEVSVGDGVSV